MAGTIFSGTYTNGITLSNPATQRPATVTGSVTKVNGSAIFGTTAFPWTVNNTGTIQNTGTAGQGVQLVQGGTINNLGTAGPGTGSLIEGYSQGILIKGAAGTATNLGTVDATGTIGSTGIVFTAGGNIVNGSSAVTAAYISGVGHGVVINGGLGTITNFGTIANLSSSTDIVLSAGGTVVNGSSTSIAASITGVGTAIFMSNGIGLVTNFGHIAGSTGLDLRAGGIFNNGNASSTTATITGTAGNAVLIVGTAGTVANFGTINATGTSAAVSLIDGGKVTNGTATDVTALINSTGTDIYISHDLGTVTNFGIVNATSSVRGNAVVIENGGGIVVNTGTMSNASTSNANVYLRGGGTVTNTKNGTHIGSISGAGTGISFRGGAGTVTNSGTIQSSSTNGIYVNGGGTITNQAGGLISGATNGIYGRGVSSSVTNAGTIQTIGTFAGIYLRGGGGLTNSGTIAGTAALGSVGVRVGAQGATITNTRVITGNIGVYGTTSGSLTLTNSGTISSTAGTAGTAVRLGNSVGQNVLIVNSGGTFIGAVNGGGSGEIDFNAASITNFFGFSKVVFGSATTHSLTLTDANFSTVVGNTITVVAGTLSDTVVATAVTTGSVTMIGGAGTDAFRGGGGNDTFEFSTSTLGTADTIVGNGGFDDTLLMTDAGTVTATHVTGVEIYRLANGGVNSLTLTNANFSGVSGGFIRVFGGSGGNTIDASAVTVAADQVVMYGGIGTDALTGGAGSDEFVFSAAALGTADTVSGGAGNDELLMTTAGALKVGGVTGVETYVLASGSGNSLTLTDANFTGVTSATITISDGDNNTSLNATAVSAANHIVVFAGAGTESLAGGAGNDVFNAGGNTTMNGEGGSDQFVFSAPGNNKISSFVHAVDQIVVHDAGFDLGVNEGTGTSTLQAISVTLFSTNTDGTFATAGNRFAYDTTTGNLFYDADGSSPAHSSQLIATVTNHPAITAADLFFIA